MTSSDKTITVDLNTAEDKQKLKEDAFLKKTSMTKIVSSLVSNYLNNNSGNKETVFDNEFDFNNQKIVYVPVMMVGFNPVYNCK